MKIEQHFFFKRAGVLFADKEGLRIPVGHFDEIFFLPLLWRMNFDLEDLLEIGLLGEFCRHEYFGREIFQIFVMLEEKRFDDLSVIRGDEVEAEVF